jgi:hypothetical protein
MAGRNDPIRVGLIGCDKRALWYGAIFDKIAPEKYAQLDPGAYHHMTYYELVNLANKRATGFKLTKVYDEDARAAAQIATAFGGRPKACHRLADAAEDVDLVFIANESGDGSDHLKLAAPGLQKGIPTFVDRPLARTVKDAQAMVRMAKRYKTPLLSCSHMRLLPHVERFKRRFSELEPLDRGIVHGHGPNPAEIADGLEMALFLFGDDFGRHVTSVQSMGAWPLETVLVIYAEPKSKREMYVLSVNSHTSGSRRAYHATASSNLRSVYADNLDAFVQSEGGLAVMNAIKRMIHTGQLPISHNEMIETVAVAEAGRKAHNKSRPCAVSKLLSRRGKIALRGS